MKSFSVEVVSDNNRDVVWKNFWLCFEKQHAIDQRLFEVNQMCVCVCVDGGLGRQERNIRNTRCSGNELVSPCLHWEYLCKENVCASCFALLRYLSPCNGFKALPDVSEDQTESLPSGVVCL